MLKTAEKLRQTEAKRQAQEKRKKYIDEMQELAKREAQVWQNVEKTLESGYTAKNYDEATELLSKLEKLAEFQESQISFRERLQQLVEKYKSRSALVGRWKKKGWV